MSLTPGFRLATVAPTATISENRHDQRVEEQGIGPQPEAAVEISSSYSLEKALVAIFQALYASATLYESRGDQIECYGYAAFGLTVAPYLVMSIINLAGNMLTPKYPSVFMVNFEIMQKTARRDDAQFNGMVGVLKSNSSVKKGTDVV